MIEAAGHLALWRAEYNPGVGSAIVLFLPAAFLYFRLLRRHHRVRLHAIAGGILFAAAAHMLLLLRVRFNVGAAVPPVVLGVIALAPLMANVLHSWRGRRLAPSRIAT